MTLRNELTAIESLPPPLCDVKWERRRAMLRLREFCGMSKDEFADCEETRLVPDFWAIAGDEFWIMEVEGTHPVSEQRILAWALLADYVGHLVTVRLFVVVPRLSIALEPCLTSALYRMYARGPGGQ